MIYTNMQWYPSGHRLLVNARGKFGTKRDQQVRHSDSEAGEPRDVGDDCVCLKRSEVGDGEEKVKAE